MTRQETQDAINDTNWFMSNLMTPPVERLIRPVVANQNDPDAIYWGDK